MFSADMPQLLDPPRPLRARRSADESGGEEILYPRQVATKTRLSPQLEIEHQPPSAFTSPQRRAKKRTSDEFEFDQAGTLQRSSKDNKANSARKRTSTSSASSRDGGRPKERRRDSTGLTISSSLKATPKHSRQPSSSSSISDVHSRRTHPADYSHLPPSPSSSSIQQFLKSSSSASGPLTPPLHSASSVKDHHSSPNVAHSLLRGTQEGWSGLDDEATAEALRKLDGLTGKSARARASVGSMIRASSSSRPGTPSLKSAGVSQWEGIPSVADKSSRRGSGNVAKDDISLDTVVEPLAGSAISSDEQLSSHEKTPKKASGGNTSARSSLVTKRGSASSTTYTSTPTTSSRDSASMSAATSATSVSAASGRHSTGKARRRDSASSDVSSTHSSDATSLKDRVASLAINGDNPDEAIVPPVPPLPKDLSTYRSPPSTAIGLTFPSTDEKDKRTSHESAEDRSMSLDVPGRRQSQHYAGYNTTAGSAPESAPVQKTPSKKWSFSALNLKLSGSPSSKLQKETPLSPRAVTFGSLRTSASKDHVLSPSTASGKAVWSPPTQPDAMNSVASLASMSSVGSARTPAVAASKTPDAPPSRSGTNSSTSTYPTISATNQLQPNNGPLSPTSSVKRGQSKRLTPSSIPFFRRSSSQSMQLHPASTLATAASPTLSSGNMASNYKSPSPNQDFNPPSTSVPGSAHKKSSVLSLGSLLKGSSSRRSLHADSKENAKDLQKVKDAVREAEKEKEKSKKEEKDRSEGRISALMGRKRGKVGLCIFALIMFLIFIDVILNRAPKAKVTCPSSAYADVCLGASNCATCGTTKRRFFNIFNAIQLCLKYYPS